MSHKSSAALWVYWVICCIIVFELHLCFVSYHVSCKRMCRSLIQSECRSNLWSYQRKVHSRVTHEDTNYIAIKDDRNNSICKYFPNFSVGIKNCSFSVIFIPRLAPEVPISYIVYSIISAIWTALKHFMRMSNKQLKCGDFLDGNTLQINTLCTVLNCKQSLKERSWRKEVFNLFPLGTAHSLAQYLLTRLLS